MPRWLLVLLLLLPSSFFIPSALFRPSELLLLPCLVLPLATAVVATQHTATATPTKVATARRLEHGLPPSTPEACSPWPGMDSYMYPAASPPGTRSDTIVLNPFRIIFLS
jgi:hypothetical protein